MKKVIAFGTFDLFHEGHRNFLRQARKQGDYLMVVIARDQTVLEIKKNSSIEDENNRLGNLKRSGLVDKVILGSLDNKYEAIKKFRPDIICLGYDQKNFIENLETELKRLGLDNTRIIRLKSFKPEVFKSSKLRIKKQV